MMKILIIDFIVVTVELKQDFFMCTISNRTLISKINSGLTILILILRCIQNTYIIFVYIIQYSMNKTLIFDNGFDDI